MSTAPTTPAPLPMLLERVRVERVERVSPSFVRVELGSPALADLGTDGPWFDQRIKLIVPEPDGAVPSLAGVGADWYPDWLALPPTERGHMRTYTIRRVVGAGESTRIVVDIVVHEPDEAHGLGPGADWATRAQVGDEVVVIAPRRGHRYGGIEWSPGTARRLLVVGDETAVPAVAGILEGLDDRAIGEVFVEVPRTEDVQELAGPPGMRVTWLVRDRAAYGERLHAAVVEHLGQGSTGVEVSDEEVDPDLWETPVFSSSGEQVDSPAGAVADDVSDLYAWIAGESRVVTGLRRVLVQELGMDRAQVAFMGYWRLGVAMRS